jgi:hypothetical protein
MPSQRESISLYGEQADRFREIRDQIEDSFDHEPKKSEVMSLLMANWPPEEPLVN